MQRLHLSVVSNQPTTPVLPIALILLGDPIRENPGRYRRSDSSESGSQPPAVACNSRARSMLGTQSAKPACLQRFSSWEE